MTDFLNDVAQQFQLPLGNNILVFSLLLFIILLSPLILKRLNIPGIIGLIIAGVIIGPHGLYIIEHNDAIELFSTIGLLYIMFIAGLELDLKEFNLNKYKSFIFAFYTFIIPILIGFPICYYLLDYSFNTSFLTASMFATHTLVAYPIVSKRGISKNQAVVITVGGTILTDTAVLLILAIIIGNAQGNLDHLYWIRLCISLLIFIFIMFWIIPKIAKWFFKKLESEKYAHYIFVLAVVFFAAFLAHEAGVEAIIGAFVAGLVLNKLIPHSSVLMNRIEFMGNALFIPFFLISVGMLVNVRVLLNGPTALIVAGTLTTVAIFGKWLAAFFTQLTFRFSKDQRQLVFGLSGAHAAATLAVILVGYKAGVIDDNILNGTVILILITCLVASFSTEKAANNIKKQEEDGTTSTLQTTKNREEQILMPIDNIDKIGQLLEFGLLIKDPESSQPISVLSVVSDNDSAERNNIQTKIKLKEFLKISSATKETATVCTTIDHNIGSGIARKSREIMANLIIMGWPHHTRFFDKLTGEKIDLILKRTLKTSFVTHLITPLSKHKRIIIFVPPLAEKEKGFDVWTNKLFILAKKLELPIHFFSTQETSAALSKIRKGGYQEVITNTEIFDDWKNIKTTAQETVKKDDLLILVLARKGSISHIKVHENLPSRIENQDLTENFIVIYPQPYDESKEDALTNVSTASINRSIDSVKKLGERFALRNPKKPN